MSDSESNSVSGMEIGTNVGIKAKKEHSSISGRPRRECIKFKNPPADLLITRDDAAQCGFNYYNTLYRKACEAKGSKCVFTGVDVYYPYKDAVVTVRSFFVLTDETINTEGTGFLMQYSTKDGCDKKYVIVTTSTNVLTSQTRVPASPIPGFAKPNTILVEINNVNGYGKSYIYTAYLIGVDGVGNVAVLGIDFKDPDNICRPVLATQVFLEWGESRCYPTGLPAYTITAPTAANSNCVIIGYVRNNHYNSQDSLVQFESVDFDQSLDVSNSGAPLISNRGEVIGIISQFGITNLGFEFIGSVSEHYAKIVVDAMATGPQGYWSAYLEVINDTLGPYFRYSKGWYGIAWTTYTATNFYQINQNNASLNLPPISFFELVGVIVTSIDASSPLFSTFEPYILTNNMILITSVNKAKVGTTPPQIILSDISHFSVPGEPFIMRYRLSNEGFATEYIINTFFGIFPFALDLVGNNVC
jgi:hypothetical protein